jgi:hypothetical protein
VKRLFDIAVSSLGLAVLPLGLRLLAAPARLPDSGPGALRLTPACSRRPGRRKGMLGADYRLHARRERLAFGSVERRA